MADRHLLPSNLRREIGEIKPDEYKSRTWAEGLELMQLFDLTKEGPPVEPTQVIYDETRGATVVGLKTKGDTAKSPTVYVKPSVVGYCSYLTDLFLALGREMIPDEGSRDQKPIWSPVASQVSDTFLMAMTQKLTT